ncbi:NUDIX hydrolase [Paenibacillus aurantiacus]|uniref:NUDIX hydrolase n=1 Tax=Paenibacillus aurantiacus TaxID=1936118 RepID=A0ABV5KYS2_9BACL
MTMHFRHIAKTLIMGQGKLRYAQVKGSACFLARRQRGVRVRYRVGVVILHGDNMLLRRSGADWRVGWTIPGGPMHLNESAVGAVEREVWDTYGVPVLDVRLLAVAVQVVRAPDGVRNEIVLYYRAELPGNHPILAVAGEFQGASPGAVHRWARRSEWERIAGMPKRVRAELSALAEDEHQLFYT